MFIIEKKHHNQVYFNIISNNVNNVFGSTFFPESPLYLFMNNKIMIRLKIATGSNFNWSRHTESYVEKYYSKIIYTMIFIIKIFSEFYDTS